MARLPYTYTMPEQFVHDPAVPTHWKLYAIINGFWINGLTAFGSNQWFSGKLKVSERQVRRALETLEKMRLIRREIYGKKRTILSLGGRGMSAYIGAQADVGRPHNSVSINADKMKASKTLSPSKAGSKKSPQSMEYVKIDEDGREETPRRPKGPKPEGKNKIAMRLQREFVFKCRKALNVSPVMDIKGYKMCLYAMNTGGLTEKQILDLFDEWFTLPKRDDELVSITRALSARQLEAYKVRNQVK